MTRKLKSGTLYKFTIGVHMVHAENLVELLVVAVYNHGVALVHSFPQTAAANATGM